MNLPKPTWLFFGGVPEPQRYALLSFSVTICR